MPHKLNAYDIHESFHHEHDDGYACTINNEKQLVSRIQGWNSVAFSGILFSAGLLVLENANATCADLINAIKCYWVTLSALR